MNEIGLFFLTETRLTPKVNNAVIRPHYFKLILTYKNNRFNHT